jgi:ACS family hexuronate transporter-like MFS transporter
MQSPRLNRLRWLILGLLFMSTVINYVDRQSMSVLLPTLRSALHLTSAHYGLITTAFLVAYTAGQIPAGIWLDRIGLRTGFSIFVAIWSLAAVLQGVAWGAISFGLVCSLMGLSEAGNWPAGAKTVASWFPQKRRALGMAFFDGGSAIGAIVAPPLVAFLALSFGWRAAFFVTGMLGLFWVAAWLSVYQSPESHRWLSSEDREAVARDCGTALVEKNSIGFALRQIIGVRQLWGLMLTRMLATPVWWFYVFWLPDYLSKGRGFSLKQIGLYAWIPFLTVDVGKFVGGALSDALLGRGRSATFSRKSVMICAALFMMSGLFVVGAHDVRLALVWVCLATFGFGMWSANILALHADIFPAVNMGSAVGATGTAASLGGAVFTFAVGQVVDKAGYSSAFWTTGLLAFLACIALVLGVGEVKRANQNAGAVMEPARGQPQ